MAKPKPIQVGVIACKYHQQPIQARVKKSLVTNKLFIDCPACGLIMPTLANFQEYVKNNAKFNEDFEAVYGDGEKIEGGGRKEFKQAGSTDISIKSKAGSTGNNAVGAGSESSDRTGSSDQGDIQRKPEMIKSDYEKEMGF